MFKIENHRPPMPSELVMKVGLEIDEKSIELANAFADAIPQGVELEVVGVAGAQLLAGIIALESDGDKEKALRALSFLTNLIEAFALRDCQIMAVKKSGEKNR